MENLYLNPRDSEWTICALTQEVNFQLEQILPENSVCIPNYTGVLYYTL